MEKIPAYAIDALKNLEKAGFEAFLVGGCVRDLIRGEQAKDFDIATSALPEQTLSIFPDSRYENIFGTVILPIRDSEGKAFDVLEITTYRSEQGYSDRRHPDKIFFESKIEKDLERRDFTVNSLALSLSDYPSLSRSNKVDIEGQSFFLVDLFGGEKDIRKKIIRAVGEPVDRFKEDALRMIRAVRFACQLGFQIEEKTERAISKLAGSIKFVANERIRDELVKILSSNDPYYGIMKLHSLKLLRYILPEIEDGYGVKQNHHHIYTVFDHNLLSLKYCPSKDWRVRLATLLHDVGKPKSKKEIDGQATFYNHEYIGAKMAAKIMGRLHFSNEDQEKVVNLVRNHMFYYNVGEVTPASVRRLIVKVGKENLQDLIDLRIADRLGSGTPKAMPYKLRHLQYMLERVQNDPVSVKMLALNGDEVMKILGILPGPKIGAILDALLADVIRDPELNSRQYLEKRILELSLLDLESIRAQAKELIEEKRNIDDQEMKRSFKV